ncbi:hypothetical protein P4S60_00190 [Pseudoalteromonas sp. Hal040]|uniref:HNH endonuclease n=1 Tax=unclassified Pseudoalteromonas TaxID=194690 RepID=UPI00301D7501
MIKLEPIKETVSECFDLCVSDIAPNKHYYRNRLEQDKIFLLGQSSTYKMRSRAKELHFFIAMPIARGECVLPIRGCQLTKNELVDLYKNYFSKKGTRARAVYDKIFISSKEQCSMCLVGTVSSLDHYLPKSRYPALSIEPLNLIPACNDCNRGKGTSVFSKKEDHFLHPYFSEEKFYNENWLCAEVIEEVPVRLRYYVNPPRSWSVDDIALIEEHFHSFKLAVKFSTFVSSHLLTAVDNVDRAINKYKRTPKGIKEDFLESAKSRPNKNSPVRVMFEALSRSHWFCSGVRRNETKSMI